MALPPRFEKQELILNIAQDQDRWGIWSPTGTGKTRLGLDIIDMHRAPSLVICPLPSIESSWKEDADLFVPHLDAAGIWHRNMDKRRQMLKEDHDIYLINYEGFKKLEDEICDMVTKKQMTVIVDESRTMQDPGSEITQSLMRLSHRAPRWYPMTGTPTDPGKLYQFYSQMMSVHPGIFDRNYRSFMGRFFYPGGQKKVRAKSGKMVMITLNWKITPANREILLRLVAQYSTTLRKEDCLDLPPKTFILRKIPMTNEQTKIYKDMMKHHVADLGTEKILAPQKIVSLMKLRQIASGFIINAKKENLQISTNKLTALKKELAELGEEQVIIWVNFKWEADAVAEMLGDKCVRATGKESKPVKDTNIKQFKYGHIQYLVANCKSLKYSLTFIKCAYAVYFSLPDSLLAYTQSQDRIHRAGQERKVTYIVLASVMPDRKKPVIDETVYLTHKYNDELGVTLREMLIRWAS